MVFCELFFIIDFKLVRFKCDFKLNMGLVLVVGIFCILT